MDALDNALSAMKSGQSIDEWEADRLHREKAWRNKHRKTLSRFGRPKWEYRRSSLWASVWTVQPTSDIVCGVIAWEHDFPTVFLCQPNEQHFILSGEEHKCNTHEPYSSSDGWEPALQIFDFAVSEKIWRNQLLRELLPSAEEVKFFRKFVLRCTEIRDAHPNFLEGFEE